MFCTECGTQMPDQSRFCPHCGTPVEAIPVPPPSQPRQAAAQVRSAPSPDRAATTARPVQTRQAPRQQTSARPVQQQTPQPRQTQNAAAVSAASADRAPVRQQNVQAVPASAPQSAPQTAPATESTGLRRFYIVDFLARMVGDKENIPLFIYLVLNVLIVSLLAAGMFSLNLGLGLLVGLLLYVLSMTVALSPLGEALLRRRTECKPITDDAVASRITPIFQEVYAKARAMNPNIPDDVKLYMNDNDSPNAFATGRRTVCVTRGLLAMSDDEIRATLGHEFGHLAHKDTDRILVVTIGNTFITAICILAQIGAIIGEWMGHFASIFMGEDGIIVRLISSASRFLTIVLITLFMKAWTAIGVALCMKTSRGNEYQADAFSCSLGYGEGLISTLRNLGSSPKPEGLFASLAASHPATEDRIARIQQMLGQGTVA